MHSAKVINDLRTVPNEWLIHAWSAECRLPSHSAKWIVAKRGSLPDSWRRRRDALSGWSGDARDWWLGNLLDLLFFLLDFFFLPGLSFFFWVLSLCSCSVFHLSVLFSLFSFLYSCFLSPVFVFRFSVVLWFSVCLPVRSVPPCYVLSAFAPLFSVAPPSVVAFLWLL